MVETVLFSDFLLFAEEAKKRETGFGDFMIPMLAIGFLFYFLLLRPQQKDQAKRKGMLATVKKNARVLTSSGIFGVITNINAEANEVTVRVDEANNTKVRMTLGSIVHVLSDDQFDEKSSLK